MRRLLLTSAGLRNDVLRSALTDLLDRPYADASIAYVPTASTAVDGDHGWLVEDLQRVHGLGWRELDVVEVNGLPRTMVLDRLGRADVIYASGGNHFHLARSLLANNLADDVATLLESRVYVGLSAGSMMFSRPLSAATGVAFGEQENLAILDGAEARAPFPWFDWYLKPHLDSPDFPDRTAAWFDRVAASVDFPVYALDDDSAVRVRGEQVDVVSAGEWRLLP